jgi:DNA repair exonuclease SbcCD nuclease subunit
MFTFLHAADIHLDSPLKGLEQYDGAPVEEIRGATRRAFENLVDLAVDREVAFVLIAGDLYDGDWRDYNTGLYFVSQIVKLRDAGIPAYVISGNHDAENKMTKSLPLPDNPDGSGVMLSNRKPETIVLEAIDVAIHGRGFSSPKMTENVVVDYPAQREGLFNIGMLHTSLDAESEKVHARYAPCKLDDLRGKGYEYWALGHVHKRAVRHEDPAVVFPGNIQGRHIREAGAKGAMLVTVHDDHRVETAFEALDVLRWEECTVAADGVEEAQGVVEAFAEQLAHLVERHEGMPLAVRVVVTGRSSAHDALLADSTRWTNQFRAKALDVAGGSVWIEKVRLRTAPARDPASAPPDEGPIGELVKYIAELRADDEELLAFASVLDDLRRKLPEDLQRGDDGVRLDDAAWLREALAEVEPLLVGRLHGRKGGA